jgi:hypothetical protein
MKRLAVAAGGLLIGMAVSIGVGACDYFDCQTIEHPLSSGTYKITGRDDYSLVLDLSGGSAVETYTYSSKPVRVEYAVGPDTTVP